MPIPTVEEGEELFECGISDIERFSVFRLQLVTREQPAIEIGNIAEFSLDRGTVSLSTGLGKTAKEQRAKEGTVERGRSVLNGAQMVVKTRLQVVLLVVECDMPGMFEPAPGEEDREVDRYNG